MSLPRHKRRDCPKCGRKRVLSAKHVDQCRRCWQKQQADISAPLPAEPEVPSGVVPLLSYEQAWRQWQKEIGMARERYVAHADRSSKRVEKPDKRRQKVLVIPDLHVPFHEPQMLAEMLRAEKDADRAVCIGDVSDAYALSRFIKYETMSFRDEWAQVTLVMEALAATFPRVDVVLGNHDTRLEKQLRLHLSADMVDAISYMTGGIMCPLTALAKHYPNVHVTKHETPSGHSISWFTTIGDAWLGHPEKFSKVPGSALRQTEDWLLDNESAMGLDRYRLIVLGHTHQLSQFPWRSHQMLVECGCLCATQGYMTDAKIGGRPQKRGYVTFEQTNGVTDLNSVRMRWLDVEQVAA